METLTQAKFFELVESSSDNPAYCESVKNAYEELTSRICKTTLAEIDFPLRYNALTEVAIHLHALQKRLSCPGNDEKSEFIKFHVEKMADLVDSQINLLKLSLDYPHMFEQSDKAQIVSPFQWSSNYTKNDLIEIISALDAVGAVESKNGEKISFRELVTGFELLFNVSLNKPYNKREEVLNRKTRTVDFLKRLTRALIDRSQK